MRRILSFLALGSMLAVAACNDANEQTPPTGPNLKRVTNSYECDFQSVKNSLIGYFSPPDLQTAQGYESSMESATTKADTIMYGFKIMDLIGQVSRSASPGSPTTGSSLTIELTKCMFDASSAAYTSLHNGGGLAAVRFDSALNYAAGGVYYVVGAGYDSKKVLAGGIPSPDPSTRLSAIAPGPATFAGGSFTLGTWSSVLAGNTYEGGRALVYGYPVTTNPIVYEWATIDPTTDFSPYALVSICDGSTDQSLMVHETGAGVLAYSQANLCGLPDATGTASGFRSHFSNSSVTTLNLKYNEAPPNPWFISKQPYPISVYVSTSDGSSILGVCVYLQGTNNNGQTTDITDGDGNPIVNTQCQSPPVSGAPYASVVVSRVNTTKSLADFGLVNITKTGGLLLTVTADVIDRSGAGSLTTKINVKP